jgi:serine/threonine protein kinase
MLTVGSTFTEELKIKLTRLIGEGGMASVYECLIYGPEDFEKVACIKLIREAYSNNSDFVKRFISEAKLVADLLHQNIVQVYKLGHIERQYYILMEYVQGVDLSTFIQRHRDLHKRVPVEIAAFIISRICRGLEYAHNKKDKEGDPLHVVHRDISPRNLMISREGEIMITDFGVAQIADEVDPYLVGKVAYMSPEQVKRQKIDSRSDLFSLGVVTYEVLTMQKLFSKNTEEVIDSITIQDIVHPSLINLNIPEALDRIVMKALEKDPAKRYQSAGEMGYDLEYFIYHKGYGPTIQTMAAYLDQFFPVLYPKLPVSEEKEIITPSQAVEADETSSPVEPDTSPIEAPASAEDKEKDTEQDTKELPIPLKNLTRKYFPKSEN